MLQQPRQKAIKINANIVYVRVIVCGVLTGITKSDGKNLHVFLDFPALGVS